MYEDRVIPLPGRYSCFVGSFSLFFEIIFHPNSSSFSLCWVKTQMFLNWIIFFPQFFFLLCSYIIFALRISRIRNRLLFYFYISGHSLVTCCVGKVDRRASRAHCVWFCRGSKDAIFFWYEEVNFLVYTEFLCRQEARTWYDGLNLWVEFIRGWNRMEKKISFTNLSCCTHAENL